MAKSEKQPEDEDTDGNVYAMLLPLAIIGSWAAGALTARWIVRREIEKLREAGTATPAREALAPAAAVPVAAAPVPAAAKAAAPAPQPPAEEVLSDEILSVLSAAVAAFAGKRARIRRARLLPYRQSDPWSQQGRVYVQASHNLGVMQR